MRKKVLSFLFAVGILPGNVYGEILPLTVGYSDDTPIFPFPHKQPVQVPEVDLSNHVLTFSEATTQNYTLTLFDEDGEVVYQTTVLAGTDTVMLPSTLSGDYVLQLIPDETAYYFYSYISL